MEITTRLSWNRYYSYYCEHNDSISINFDCRYGCQDSVVIFVFCIESTEEETYFEGHEIHVFNVSDINAVTIDYRNYWAYLYERVNLSTTFSLVPRVDTGKINSSPRVANFPKLQLLEGHEYTIPLAVIDPDGDDIQCRWAVGAECSGVCYSIPGAVLDPNSCTITYHANNGTGPKVVAIMIEDFLPSLIIPLSSVPYQFLVEVINSSGLSCPSLPQFVTAPRGTSCIAPNTAYSEEFIATSGCANVSITSIQIIAPIGASKGELQYISGTNNYYINITWMPNANQQNDTHFLCFMAYSSEGITSNQSCIKLAVGYYPPTPLTESATPNHQFVYPSNNTLRIMFDRTIQRPSESSFIRFHNSGEMVYQIDASSSKEVRFNGPNLTVVPSYVFTEGNIYYVNFDDGIVESIERCLSENDSAFSETFWTFEVLNFLPGKRSIVLLKFVNKLMFCHPKLS